MFTSRQPGGLWHPANRKALSFGWAMTDGFGGAMRSVGCMGGSIRQSNMCGAVPMVMTTTKPQNAPYMSAGMAGGGIMDFLKSALSYGKSFVKGVIPYSIRGSSFGTPGSYMTT